MAENKRDYYDVLGISKNADEAAIKKAYRVLAKKYHPDANPGDKNAEKMFKEASEAYAVLSDPEKRRQYDQFGHAAFEGGAGGSGGFGGFGPIQGANVRTSVRLTFEEAIFGCEKEISINYKEECSTCHGSGAKPGTTPETCTKCNGKGKVMYTQQSFFGTVQNVQTCSACGGSGKVIKDKCSACRGSGYVIKKKTFKVKIPAGIDNGLSVRMAGGGEPGVNGGPRGDLLVSAVVSDHPIFKRQDINIFSTVPVSFTKAALGGKINIKTVDGEVEYEVKPGTQTDTKIRLKGKGVPSLRSSSLRGDHYVTLVVQVPTMMTPAQKEALRAYDEAMNAFTKNDEKTRKKGFFSK